MTYQEVQAKARQLREKGLLPKKFNLKQKKTMLLEAINSVENEQTNTPTQKGPKATRRHIYETLERQVRQVMSQDEFNKKFVELYVSERKRQELEGIVVSRVLELKKKFQDKYYITDDNFDKLLNEICKFRIWENKKEIFELSLEYKGDGKYQLIKPSKVQEIFQ